MRSGVRVLELARPKTMLAGQILADLGADVIAVEPPGGAPGRRMGPFLDDRIGLERSLTWHALNRNKRSITIDTDSTDGRDAFERIAATADVVIEAAPARFAALADRGHGGRAPGTRSACIRRGRRHRRGQEQRKRQRRVAPTRDHAGLLALHCSQGYQPRRPRK